MRVVSGWRSYPSTDRMRGVIRNSSPPSERTAYLLLGRKNNMMSGRHKPLTLASISLCTLANGLSAEVLKDRGTPQWSLQSQNAGHLNMMQSSKKGQVKRKKKESLNKNDTFPGAGGKDSTCLAKVQGKEVIH